MVKRIADLPFFVLLLGIAAQAALVPAIHALLREDFVTARIFFYGMILGSALALGLAIATGNRPQQTGVRGQLTALALSYGALPVFLAVPFYIAVGNTSAVNAWFEMVSSLTTTGATVYDNANRLNSSLHLWRALVGWMGGFLIWVTAFAILAPLNLGGFEVRATSGPNDGRKSYSQDLRAADPGERLIRYALQLLPVYLGLSGALAVGLMIAGEVPIVAVCHAMSILATSGISPIGGTTFAASGVAGEVLMFGFLIFALSRYTYSRVLPGEGGDGPIHKDPELRLAFTLIGLVTALLFLRHFIGTGVVFSDTDIGRAGAALWGALFTVISFITTTGFESRHWLLAADWSGLPTPGLVLLGLTLIGGGVATTAGGVKLLRVYALFRHGQREMEKLVHPHSIGGSGTAARRIRRQGAQIAWIFFMLFTVSITLLMGALTLTGMQFDTAMVLAVSALSTTGPLADVGAEYPILISGIPDAAKVILAGAMILGRLEALALIALLNPELWRS